MVKHLNYISFERFFSKLEATVQDFTDKIQNRPYLLWIPSKEGGSDRWVASLALEYGKLPWPTAICDSSHITEVLTQHPEIQDVLLLDDASYSGSHLSTELRHLKNDIQPVRVFIGIPFMTSYVPLMIFKKHKHHQYMFLQYHTMPMLKELLSKKEIDVLQKFQLNYQTETLTYFDHTYPDYWSTIANFNNGMHLLRPMSAEVMRSQGFLAPWDVSDTASAASHPMSDEAWNVAIEKLFPDTNPPITPFIIQPYKLMAKKDNFIEALVAKTLGERTSYPVPPWFAVMLKQNGMVLPAPALSTHIRSIAYPTFDSCRFSFNKGNEPPVATIIENDDENETASAALKTLQS